jgi:hypothetical protein
MAGCDRDDDVMSPCGLIKRIPGESPLRLPFLPE